MLYNDKLKQDFLKPELVFQLQNAGVDMKDAYYHIYKSDGTYYLSTYNWLEGLTKTEEKQYEYICPTYTLSELLYKLNEYPCKEITLTKGKYAGKTIRLCELTFFKDTPYYFYGYDIKFAGTNEIKRLDEWYCYSKYPVEAAAYLLLKCIENGIDYSHDISDKL